LDERHWEKFTKYHIGLKWQTSMKPAVYYLPQRPNTPGLWLFLPWSSRCREVPEAVASTGDGFFGRSGWIRASVGFSSGWSNASHCRWDSNTHGGIQGDYFYFAADGGGR
jgi:hypothetical protein